MGWDPSQRPRRELAQSFALSIGLPAALGALVPLAAVLAHRRGRFEVGPQAAMAVVGFATVIVMVAVLLAQRGVSGATHAHLRAMEHRASHDELTGLLARDELRSRLDTALRSAYRHDRVVGVLFLDLDGFKAINDSMGHRAGDQLLIEFGARLRDSVRSEDLVARFGGDEFVVVTLGLDRLSAVRDVAQNLRQAFEQPIEISEGSVVMTPSIGVSIGSRRKPGGPDELLAGADSAMYRAKKHRLGVEVFDDHQRQESLDRREVQQALVPALADGQFTVHYQPIVSESRQEAISLEGLVRWQHPQLGTIGPDRFLGEAEEAGLIARLGDVVLREAVAQTSVWNHQFASGDRNRLRISLNMAERQLVDPRFVDRVADVLAWAGVDPTQLELEIGEAVLLRRIDDPNRVVRRLAELGCDVIIDNYGLAAGGLSSLQGLDLVRAVKIDRSITSGLASDGVSRAVVEATVAMARAIGIDVIAEGVETPEQRQLVVDMGIDLMQGFLFQHPMSATDYEGTLPFDAITGSRESPR